MLRGKFHPLLIHFPIALVLAAALAEILGVLGRLERATDIARFMLTLSAASIVPVILSGWLLADSSYGSAPADTVLTAHRWAGITTALATLGATAAAWFVKAQSSNKATRRLYWLLLGISVVAVSITGHLGATLVYGRSYWGFAIPFIE